MKHVELIWQRNYFYIQLINLLLVFVTLTIIYLKRIKQNKIFIYLFPISVHLLFSKNRGTRIEVYKGPSETMIDQLSSKLIFFIIKLYLHFI